MQNVELVSSVGSSGKNKAIDVAIVQALLKSYFTSNKSDASKEGSDALKEDKTDYSKIAINGSSSTHLVDAIKKFQSDVVGMKTPDGRIDAGGGSFKKLLGTQATTTTSLSDLIFGKSVIHTGILSTIATTRFKTFFKQYHGLTVSKGEDLSGFFEMLKKDPDIKDIRWAAYMLATVYHETTFSFKPKHESGKGKDYSYGKEIEVTDTKGIRGKVGNKYKNVYYGRGYVQITWDYNYKSVGAAIGVGDNLYIKPDLAVVKETAYKITSVGMRDGLFTNKKLSDYIGAAKTDYKNARRIINGTDKASKIAGYAKSMEYILRLAAKPSAASE